MDYITTLTNAIVALAQTSPPAAGTPDTGVSVLEFVHTGGLVGYTIIALSIVAVALCVMHALQLRHAALVPPELFDELADTLTEAKPGTRERAAEEFCTEPENTSFLTSVLGAGLARCRRSALGTLELKSALEEAGQTQIARLSRSTDALALIAATAPMLGLLGTVIGISKAFNTLGISGGIAQPDVLAGDISYALTTTIMGLILAIPATAAVTYFRNRIEAVASLAAADVEELAGYLETDNSAASTGKGHGA